MTVRITTFLRSKSELSIFLVGLGFSFVISYLDFITGREVSFSIFYLAPISLVSWIKGRRIGIAMSVICALEWLIVDLNIGYEYSHFLIPYWNALVRFVFFIITASLLSLLRDTLQRESLLARTDSLSGVLNSRYFRELANMELKRASRLGYPVTLVFCDIDNLKEFNDEKGHLHGDAMLAEFGRVLKSSIRETDMPVRMGGDEFAILLPDAEQDEALQVWERFIGNFTGVMMERKWNITLSAGAITCRDTNPTLEEMIKSADSLMYTAKRKGKNRIEYRICDGI